MQSPTNEELEQTAKELSIAEIEAQIQKAEFIASEYRKRLAIAKQAERQREIDSLVQSMNAKGITIYDLASAFDVEVVRHKRQRPTSATQKLLPKYQDPATKATWTGRGSVPNWLKAYEANGRQRNEFLIRESAK